MSMAWTGHSLRIGLASAVRRAGRDAIAIAIADQGGWARRSRSMLGYVQRDDGWDDNASAGRARTGTAQPRSDLSVPMGLTRADTHVAKSAGRRETSERIRQSRDG
ncbi:hypothetical protein ABZ135_12910 [Streptomyces sp. NPDC006339]|uniref:hypothetical protein n=1 Tax=Streptomyces sp. NPDC006339 TaxID=3156755 RepID=UPI0033B371AC